MGIIVTGSSALKWWNKYKINNFYGEPFCNGTYKELYNVTGSGYVTGVFMVIGSNTPSALKVVADGVTVYEAPTTNVNTDCIGFASMKELKNYNNTLGTFLRLGDGWVTTDVRRTGDQFPLVTTNNYEQFSILGSPFFYSDSFIVSAKTDGSASDYVHVRVLGGTL